MTEVQVTPLKSNNGRMLTDADTFTLSYTVALSADDLVANRYIDSSDWYDKPVVAGAGGDELLPGLELAVKGRAFGDTLLVRIPSELAFGKRGVPGRVPPNAPLFVQIEIAAFESANV